MSIPLRVILDDRPLRRTLTGVGNYIAQLLLHLPTYAPDVVVDPFVFQHIRRRDWRSALAIDTTESDLGNLDDPAAANDSNPADVGGGRKPWWLRRLIQTAYGSVFRFKTRGRYSLYHEPNHVPIRCDLPTVTTIHDLSVLIHPQWHPADRVKWYDRDFAAGVKQTRRFLAASEFTKREMVERLGIAIGRIHVTYQAPRRAFRPMPSAQVESFRRGWGLPRRFFLFVGTLEPRKNVTGLLDAFAMMPEKLRSDTPLVIAGAWGWKAAQLREKLAERSLSKHVRLLGYLRDPQLALLYNSCTALVWPSFYEGFGLPPLEALACGAVVIVSNVASLPEVVGDAGRMLDPYDVSAWARAMVEAIEPVSAESADSQRQRSLAQVAKFTWAAFIRDTVSGYRAALDG